MKANYELKRIGIGLKTPILLLLLFLAAVFQLKAQAPELISDPEDGHYCINPPDGGVILGIRGGQAVSYTLWKDGSKYIPEQTIAGTGSTVSPVYFSGTWTYGTYTLNGPWGAPFSTYLTVYRDEMPTNPASGTATPTTIICGESAELSAEGGSGTTFSWYTGSEGGTLISHDNPLTVTPTETTEYYGRWENVTCFSNSVTLTVTVNPRVAPIIEPVDPICSGTSATIKPVDQSSVLEWYTDGCGITGVATQTGDFETDPLTITTTYWVRKAAIAGGCGAGACASVTVVVDTKPSTPIPDFTSYNVCLPGTATMTVEPGTPGTTWWYQGSCGTDPNTAVTSGTTYAFTPTVAGTEIFYVRTQNACDGDCISITVTAYDPPDTPSATASPTTICSGNETTLTATGGNPGDTYHWYEDCGGTEVSTGPTYVVSPTALGTKPYYVTSGNDGCGESECNSVTVTVIPIPGKPTIEAASAVICLGSTTTLTVTATGGEFTGSTIEWYANGEKVAAMSGMMTPTVEPNVTTGYYARFENSNCFGLFSDVVTVTVGYIPTTPTIIASAVYPGVIENNTICKGTFIDLNVTGGGATEPPDLFLKWYRGFSPCAGTYTPTYTGTTFTDRPDGNTNYYAQYSNSCGFSGCATISICVEALPSAPTSISITKGASLICNGTIVELTANGSPGEIINPCPDCPPQPIKATIYWYKNNCGTDDPGVFVATGTTITVTPTTSTSYYARYENVCGASSCASTTITVNEVSNPTSLTATLNTICKGNTTELEVGFVPVEDFLTPKGTITWYKSELVPGGGCGSGEKLTSTATSITVSPTVTTYYYVRTENTNGGLTCYSTCTSTVVTVLNPLTPSISVSDDRICYDPDAPQSVTLTATVPPNATGVVHWYKDNCGVGTAEGIATGTTYIVTPTGTITYYAKMIDGSCYSADCASTTITVDTKNTIGTISATFNPVCSGSSTTLHVAWEPDESGTAALRWYSGSIPCGGKMEQEGGDLTVTPVITSRYFARVESVNGGVCPSSGCESITITLLNKPTTPVITTPNTTICSGNEITIKADAGPEGTTINWYEGDHCGEGVHSTGTSLTVSPTTPGDHYYWAQMTNGSCTPSECASVTITVSERPALPTNVTLDHSICYGQPTTLSATSGTDGVTIAWYKDGCGPEFGGTPVSSGPGPEYAITVTPTTQTKYYVRTESTNCTPSQCVSVTVTVNPLPKDPVSIDASATTICYGKSVTMIPHVQSNEGDYAKWYTGSNPCGGTLTATITSASGALTVTPTLTTLYYVTWNNDCGESNCAQILITVINPPVAPTSATATPGTICLGKSSALSVTNGSGETLKWYTNAACTIPASGTVSGTNFIVTPADKGTHVYYARYETPPCAESAAVSATVVVNTTDPVPTITTTPMTVCVNNVDVTLNATQGAGSIGTLRWYTGSEPCGETLVGTGPTLHVTSAICTKTTTFFVLSKNDCGSSDCAKITVTVDQIPADPTNVAGPGTMCSGTLVHLTADAPPAGSVTKWYTGGCGEDYLNTGSDITVSPTNFGHSNSTEYYYARNENTCVSSCKTVTIVVNPANIAPTKIIATPETICNGASTELKAEGGSGLQLKWYTGSSPCGGEFFSSDNPVTVSPVITSKYFARYEGGLCTAIGCTSVTVVVNDKPQTPTSISQPVTICQGSETTLSATYITGNGISLKWYKNDCEGEPVPNYQSEGNTLVVSPTETTIYYARTEAPSCDHSDCLSVTVTVNKAGTIASVSQNTAICNGKEATLTATTSGGINNTIKWYTGSCGGTFVQSGSELKVSPTGNTTYYVRSEAEGCTSSECASVTVTVNPLPEPPTGISATLNPVCNGTPTTLKVENGSGSWVSWFNGSSACGGIFISTSTLSLTVAPTITTIYWARWENNCGVTGCVSKTITVSDVPQVPTTISPAVTICKGNSTTLTASFVAGAGVTLKWYDVDPVTNPVATPITTGGTLNVAPTVTTTYYARTESAGCTASACKTVTVTVSDVPTTPTGISGPVTICSGKSTTLTATYNTGVGISLKWYDVNPITNPGASSVWTGGSYTVAPGATTTYYARTESTSCTASSCLSVTVTVVPAVGNLTLISKSPSDPVCAGTPVTLTASGATFTTGAILKWYTGGCGGTLIASSASLYTLTVTPTENTTYYARFDNDVCQGACVSVTVFVKPLPVAPTSLIANPNPVCIGHSTTITANGNIGAGSILEWYSGSLPCDGPLVASNTSSITVFPQINPTQYSAHTRNECGVSACAVVDVYIDPLPVAPDNITASATIVCVGTPVTMTAHGGSGTVLNWYLGGCGQGDIVGTGTVLTVTPTADTYTYFARWDNACEPSTCAEITFTVYPIPTAPIINGPEHSCAGNPITITAEGGGGNGSTIKWYKDNCGGTAIASGVTSLNVSPTATTTYFARYENSACMSECASKTITVYAVPVAPTSASASEDIICEGSTTVLSVPDGSGEILVWYKGTCGGSSNKVGEGNNLTITPTATAIYYARWENSACQSTCASVTVEVVESPIAPTKAKVTDAEICEGTSVQLTAEGGSHGTAKWYSGGCGLQGGGTFEGEGVGPDAALTVTPTLGTTVYYVRYENPPCDASACAAITVTTYATLVAPTSITANPPVVGVGLPTTLIANGSGETLLWYNGACGGQSIGSGNPFVVTVTGNTTYYAKWTNPGCGETGCASVTVTTETLALSGVVKYNNQYNVALNGVHIELKQGGSVIQDATTSTQIVGGIPTPGYYSFTNLVPGTYTLNVTPYGGTWGGVNATDALVIEQHDAGLLTLLNLYLTAGDVNADTYVNSIDALWVKMRTVGMVNYFDAGNWVFGTTTSGSLPAINLTTTQTFNFVGLCTGDVNGSFIPSGTKEASFISFMDDGIRYVKPGETFTYDVVADKNAEVGAMTLFMNYDENLVEVEKVSSVLGEVQSKIEGNNIGVAWSSVNPANVDATTPVLTLTMKAKGTIEEPKQVFTVNGGSEFANGNAIRLDNLNLKMAKLATATHSFSLNNYPNPFNNSTNIVYTLPEKAHVTLVITNLYGEVLRTVVNGDVSAGAHQVTVNASDLNLSTGVYLYKIEVNGETDNFSQVNKMIFTR